MFFPIKDYNPTSRTAVLTIIFIVLNVIVFVNQAVFSDLDVQILDKALIPWEITHFKNVEQPLAYRVGIRSGSEFREPIYRDIPPFLTLFTSIFMHGSLLHLLGNMLFLWIFGNNIEDYLGMVKFVLFYLVAGLGASLLHVIFNPNSLTPVVGASGAISGIMGAYLILYPTARIRTLVFFLFFFTFMDVPAFVFLIVWFIFQFVNLGGGGGIAWLAHVGGFLIGVVLIKYFRPRKPANIEVIQ